MRLTLKPNWMVTWQQGRAPMARHFLKASEAWKCWEEAKGSEIGIYRRKEIKGPRGTRVVWEQVDYENAAA